MSFINKKLEEMREDEEERSCQKLKIIGIGHKDSYCSTYFTINKIKKFLFFRFFMASFSHSEEKGNISCYGFLPKSLDIINIVCSVANTFLLTSQN